MSVRQGNGRGLVVDPALSGRRAKAVGSTSRKNEAPDENQRVELHDLRASSSAAPGALVQRLIDTGLRLHALRDSDALYESLIDEVAHLIGAQRVLLVLIDSDGCASPARCCRRTKIPERCSMPLSRGSRRRTGRTP